MSWPERALSLRQPWCDAVVRGGKRIENRLKWTNSTFRGELLLHAAKGMTMAEYSDAVSFAVERKLTAAWPRPPIDTLKRGGIVGIARVIGVVNRPNHILNGRRDFMCWVDGQSPRDLTDDEKRWWMGSFALVLDDVRPLPFVACSGSLGFFRVPKAVHDVLTTLTFADSLFATK